MKLPNRWVFVTGAAKRIGQSIALEFAKQGCNILLHYHHSESEAKKTSRQIQSFGSQVELLQLDLTNIDAVQTWIKSHCDQIQNLSVIVHSASIFHSTDIRTSQANRQAFHVIHHQSPLLISSAFAQQKNTSSPGVILNITDAMIEKPYPGYADYFISKAALQEQTRTLSIEYAPHVRVNSIAPGCVLFPDGYDEDRKKALLQSVPLRREGTPQDIANACVFLAQQDYITGQTLKVDGGRSLS